MKCGVCHFVPPTDGSGHTARTCPLRQPMCRMNLPTNHPFHQKGECGDAKCVHHKQCGVCGLPGHQYGTQTFALDRWTLKDGRLLRKACKRDLDESDFVCVMMNNSTVKNLVDNTQSFSAAASQLGVERRKSVSRLRGNTHAEGVDLDESVRLLQSKGSKASLLHGNNKVAFDALVEFRGEGAVAANRHAADAVESDVDDSGEAGTTEDDDDDDKDALNREGGSHPGRRLPGGRVGLYAAAINKGKSLSKSPQRSVKGKGRRKKAVPQAASPQPHPVAVNGDRDSVWPSGTRSAFSALMPAFHDQTFGSSSPLRVAHLVIEQLCQCPVADADPQLSALLIKGALESHVRGYSLMSGTLSAAQVADWLCSAMPLNMQPPLLSSVARAVESLVRRRSRDSATASAPSSEKGPRNVGSSSREVRPAVSAGLGPLVLDVDAAQAHADTGSDVAADDSAEAVLHGQDA